MKPEPRMKTIADFCVFWQPGRHSIARAKDGGAISLPTRFVPIHLLG